MKLFYVHRSFYISRFKLRRSLHVFRQIVHCQLYTFEKIEDLSLQNVCSDDHRNNTCQKFL